MSKVLGAAPVSQPKPLLVMVTGRDEAWRQALRESLVRRGWRLFAVATPLEAAASAAGRDFHAIVLEADPEIEAMEAARRIRLLPALPPGPALIGVFPNRTADLAHRAANGGFDAYLVHEHAQKQLAPLIALLSQRVSVQTAEFDQVEQENQDNERTDGDERSHADPLEAKHFGAL